MGERNEMLDLVITDGLVIDGTGRPGYIADLGINGEKIVSLGSLGDVPARKRIEARGLVVVPGFIDIHTHSDISLLLDPVDEPRLRQGVTTVVFSNCGIGFAPATRESLEMLKKAYVGAFGNWSLDVRWQRIREYLDQFQGRTTVNIAYLVPHAAVRVAVMGMAARAATEREVRQMAELVRQGMEDGAFGLSTGLYYTPMRFAGREEMMALLRVVKEYGGFFAIHLRDYFAGLFPSLREALELAEAAEVPVQVSHLQAAGRQNWGKADALLSLIDQARHHGVDVTIDSYPYMAGSTFLHSWLPEWAQADGADEILKRLTDPQSRRQIVLQLEAASGDWANVIISGVSTLSNQPLIGRSLQQIAHDRAVAAAEAVCQLLVEEGLEVSFIYHHGNEKDVCRIMQYPHQMIGSDGIQTGQRPHPRLYGAFVRFLGQYVRDRSLLSLEEALRKTTSLPASRLKLSDRGQLKEGMVADVVIFNARTVEDRATYDDPCQFAQGVDYVIVNGAIVKDPSGLTAAMSGRLLGCRLRA